MSYISVSDGLMWRGAVWDVVMLGDATVVLVFFSYVGDCGVKGYEAVWSGGGGGESDRGGGGAEWDGAGSIS